MSAAPTEQLSQAPSLKRVGPPPSSRWIKSPWWDQSLIVFSPLVIVPVVYFACSPRVGIKDETIALIVTAFFALGHHLPGMMRAYADRELFQRFYWRFVLTPPILAAVIYPLQIYHFDFVQMTFLIWGCWHGLMQLYGFVRIYDAKVGSVAPVTAYWDWLMCLCWFSTGVVFSHEKMSNLLDHFYTLGGPLILPLAVQIFRWSCLAICVAVSIGFAVNYVIQWQRGPKPNPVKILMLVSGIGFWWFAFVYVGNILLGVALFEIAHDIQYMAIAWLYNCRRVKSNPEIDGFMKFVFGRSMVLLYVGLIAAYGAIGLIPGLVQDGTVKTIFSGILLVSTLLHYYYDGFIWKVRESSTRTSLGLKDAAGNPRGSQLSVGAMTHLLKWSPMIVFTGWLFMTDFIDSPLSAATKSELKKRYSQTMTNSTSLPAGTEEKSWLYSEFERTRNIAAAVPGDRGAQLRAAIMMSNFGQHGEAIAICQKLTAQHPAFSEAHLAMGQIHNYRGDLDNAAKCFQAAMSHATTASERANAALKRGEIYLRQKDVVSAEAIFQDALKENPTLDESIKSLRKLVESSAGRL